MFAKRRHAVCSTYSSPTPFNSRSATVAITSIIIYLKKKTKSYHDAAAAAADDDDDDDDDVHLRHFSK